VEGGQLTPRPPFGWTIVVVETLVSLGGLAGSIQLLAGVAAPPVSAFSPLWLSNWTLPAAWLFLSVAVPSGLAAWLAWRRSDWTAPAVLLGERLLAIELLVQIPFLGLKRWGRTASGSRDYECGFRLDLDLRVQILAESPARGRIRVPERSSQIGSGQNEWSA
jgi:hypothetical protein